MQKEASYHLYHMKSNLFYAINFSVDVYTRTGLVWLVIFEKYFYLESVKTLIKEKEKIKKRVRRQLVLQCTQEKPNWII